MDHYPPPAPAASVAPAWPEEPLGTASADELAAWDYDLSCAYLEDYGWYGVLGRYGDIVGRSPMNWLAGYAALCARISRNVAWQHAYPHYGMEYCLLLMEVGSGKSASLDRARRAFAGPTVTLRQGVQSGQALVESLGKYEDATKEHQAGFTEVYRTLLYEPEFTGIFDASNMQASTLLKELVGLYDASDSYSLLRVNSRGGETLIRGHQLSLLAAAPVHAFRTYLKPKHLRSGLMSRCLTFLCTGTKKGPWAQTVDLALLHRFQDTLPPPDFRVGDENTPVWEFYDDAARNCYEQYCGEVAGFDDDTHPLRDWFARTQAHFHRIALNLMWADGKTQVSFDMASAAYAACHLWISSVIRFTSQEKDITEDSNYNEQRQFCARWVFDHVLAKQPVSRRELRQICRNSPKIKHLWPQISEEITRQVKNGTLIEKVVGKKTVLYVA
jgi:hypothetical protein